MNGSEEVDWQRRLRAAAGESLRRRTARAAARREADDRRKRGLAARRAARLNQYAGRAARAWSDHITEPPDAPESSGSQAAAPGPSC